MSTDQDAVFCPEELSLLGEGLDRTMQSLPPKMRRHANLAEIAKKHLGLCSYW
jgi:hypothetical protein